MQGCMYVPVTWHHGNGIEGTKHTQFTFIQLQPYCNSCANHSLLGQMHKEKPLY